MFTYVCREHCVAQGPLNKKAQLPLPVTALFTIALNLVLQFYFFVF